MAAVTEDVWSARDTTPAEVDSALRGLLVKRHAESAGSMPARVLNLVVVVDREWSGEIANRLRGVGRYHPSRSVVCAVEPGRRRLDARAVIASGADPAPAAPTLTRETVVVTVGEEHLDVLDTIVDPLLISDLPTVVWSPHGHPEAVDALLDLAQVVLVDSIDEDDAGQALARAKALSERAYVVDLAWLRSTPWRERLAGAFDPPALREELGRISAVTVRHHAASGITGLLFLGWLCSRLGWRPAQLVARDGALHGTATAGHGDVVLRTEAVDQGVRGLAGVTVETAAGASLALDRASGGLRAVRRTAGGRERSWLVAGASRGEAGILGEGIRQALLRDPTYRPALRAAEALAP
jgi:glucose-6-phosphate dehydrogenase assembly protein OpcA